MFHVGLGYPVSLICVLLRFTMLYCVLSLYFMYWCIDLFSSTAARVFIKLFIYLQNNSAFLYVSCTVLTA